MWNQSPLMNLKLKKGFLPIKTYCVYLTCSSTTIVASATGCAVLCGCNAHDSLSSMSSGPCSWNCSSFSSWLCPASAQLQFTRYCYVFDCPTIYTEWVYCGVKQETTAVGCEHIIKMRILMVFFKDTSVAGVGIEVYLNVINCLLVSR